jgi:hypothetical protein
MIECSIAFAAQQAFIWAIEQRTIITPTNWSSLWLFLSLFSMNVKNWIFTSYMIDLHWQYSDKFLLLLKQTIISCCIAIQPF